MVVRAACSARRGPTALRLAAAAVGLAALAGCAAMIEEARRPAPQSRDAPVGQVSLLPELSIEGGRAAAGLMPFGGVATPRGTLPVRFVRPVAIAVQGPRLIVADAALVRTYSLDPWSGTPLLAQLPAPLATEGLRLAAAPDGSLFAVDGARAGVARFGADGRPSAPLEAPGDLGRAVDVAVSSLDGRVAVADGLHTQLLLFNPIGRAWTVVPVASGARVVPVAGLTRVAIGARSVYASAASCACVIEAPLDGRPIRRIASPELDRPTAIAVDAADRLFAFEPDSSRLSVVVDGRAVQRFSLRELRLRAISDIKIADDRLYLADPLAGRVEVRRIVPRHAGNSR